MSIFDRLSRITGIDLSTGQRGVQPMKEVVKKSKEKDLTRLAEAYGGLDKIPDSLKPIKDVKSNYEFLKGNITRLDKHANEVNSGKTLESLHRELGLFLSDVTKPLKGEAQDDRPNYDNLKNDKIYNMSSNFRTIYLQAIF